MATDGTRIDMQIVFQFNAYEQAEKYNKEDKKKHKLLDNDGPLLVDHNYFHPEKYI